MPFANIGDDLAHGNYAARRTLKILYYFTGWR
jgi:hypothetical protein